MRYYAALGLWAASLIASAEAGNEKGEFFIMGGPGAMTCGEFTRTKDTGTVSGDYGNWLSGYVSALNRTTPGVYNLLEGIAAADFYLGVVEVCGEFPNERMETVTYNLLVKSHDAHTKAGAAAKQRP